MNLQMEPGIYVVAVSGGVDSMVLLDLLVKQVKSEKLKVKSLKKGNFKLSTLNFQLIVGHFDHGIRVDSDKDRELVQQAAAKYGLPFVYDKGNLGAGASEAEAREARYKFLTAVAKAAGAKAIVTAHHQDDVLETAIINMLRGTNRRGLSSLKDLPNIKRPLLDFTKAEILNYAQQHQLQWHDDSTNQDTSYLRNYVRHKILPKFSEAQKAELLKHINNLGNLNTEIDNIIENMVKQQSEIDRQWFISLDHNVARDVMASWLRAHNVKDIDKKHIELLVRAAKIYKPNKKMDVDKQRILEVGDSFLALRVVER